MSKKKIVVIGVEIASDEIDYYEFDSDISLLDWDIIIFNPNIYLLVNYSDKFRGKPRLYDDSSFKLKDLSNHWKREINDAVEAGKTVIFYLQEMIEVFISTGNKEFSGTGRNQKTTNIVENFDNYMCIPKTLNAVSRKGNYIKLASKDSDLIAPYWIEFGSQSSYKVVLNNKDLTPILVTKNGDKSVGVISKAETGKGALIILPELEFYQDGFLIDVEDEKGDRVEWTEKARVFANKYIKSIVSIDKALSYEVDITPEPAWATSEKFIFSVETTLKLKLENIKAQLSELSLSKEKLMQDLKNAGNLRGLLFEGGKSLESELINALRIIGFEASNYEDKDSEFDIVFSSEEGRLIGEAEGKDNKAINITKLRQLALNIHEDFEKDEVQTQAKGVLFGNAYRLMPLDKREDPFTDKCKTAAVTSSTALVFTPDLFEVVHYLSNNEDPSFAKKCREILLDTIGRVKFPDTPTH